MASTRPPIKTRLRKWHLTQVPFPSVPFVNYMSEDPISNGSVYATELRQQQVDQIRAEILKFGFAKAVQEWSWVWAHRKLGGSLGMGKTALLGFVTDQINIDYGSSFFHAAAPWLAVYVKVPETIKSLQDVAAVALESLYHERHGTSGERLLLARVRRELILLDKAGKYPQNLGTEKTTAFGRDDWLDAHGVNRDALTADVKEKLMRAGVKAEVAKAFATASFKEYLSQYKDDPDATLFKTPYKGAVWPLLLGDVAKIVIAAGLQHVTFFLDDFYFLVKNVGSGQLEGLAAELRNIVVMGDSKATKSKIYNWVAVMHTQTSTNFNHAWQQCDMHHVAPMIKQEGTDIVRPGVHLYALKAAQGRTLLETYLRYSHFGKVASASFPFTSEALDFVVEYAGQQGREEKGSCDPRNALEVAHDVFVQVLMDADDHPEIDLAQVKHILKGIPLSPPIPPTEVEANERADEEQIQPSEQKLPPTVECSCPCHQEDATLPNDAIAVWSGGVAGKDTQRQIVGYRCGSCGAPIILGE
jgi:hypothetical protein